MHFMYAQDQVKSPPLLSANETNLSRGVAAFNSVSSVRQIFHFAFSQPQELQYCKYRPRGMVAADTRAGQLAL